MNTITGTGAGSYDSHGVFRGNSCTQVSTVAGALTITGSAGRTTGGSNLGVYVEDQADAGSGRRTRRHTRRRGFGSALGFRPARKLGGRFWDYLQDRLRGRSQVPGLTDLIHQRAVKARCPKSDGCVHVTARLRARFSMPVDQRPSGIAGRRGGHREFVRSYIALRLLPMHTQSVAPRFNL